MRILIVEDEKRLAQTLGGLLARAGYAYDLAYDGDQGLDCALSGIYDGVVLDVMLPGKNGFQVVEALRRAGRKTPVLLLTARAETGDKVQGLDSGADYYLTKPFDSRELLACLRAVLRRQEPLAPEVLAFGGLTLNLSACTLGWGEKWVKLSAR